jgi:hypothetical protein
MPRWVSRLTLIVQSVKVERVQEITYEDALAEGVGNYAALLDVLTPGEYSETNETSEQLARRLRWPQRAFAALWRSLHGEDAWTANPYVAAITFRAIKSNIDALPAPAAEQSK